LTARRSLVPLMGKGGSCGWACDQDPALLPIRERILGLRHPATLTARGNLSYWTRQSGR